MTEEIFDADEAISFLKTSRPTFYRWLKSGRIQGFKVGKQWRFYKKDLVGFMESSGTDFVMLKREFKEIITFFEEKLEKKGIERSNDMSETITYPDEKELLTKKALDGLLLDALTDKASDIHLEPLRQGFMVKYRLGGSLKDIKLLSLDIATEVIFRLKEMSALKTDVTDKVQKGNIVIETDKIAEDKKFDIKVSIIPAFYGERIAMRIVSVTKIETTTNRGFEILAFQGHDLEQVQKIFNKHFGLIIITGLSGSGKTTTCYAALNYLVKRYAGKANIMSLENPVEYPLEGLVQIPVRPEMEGQGFYELLKASWDQDPDVIFTGELPDKNTARIISELALTGHIVIVQMDSPDVLQAVARLSDLGLEPYLLASSLEGVIAQRLVRCICEHCKEEFIPSPQIIEKYFPPMKEKVSLYRGKGCKECHGTGYKKRAGIYEILNPDTDFKEALARGENVNNLKKILQKKGFETLREKALKSALFGMTTLEEALRVSYSS